jgi:hypothetical protein
MLLDRPAGVSLWELLDQNHVTLFYVDSNMMRNLIRDELARHFLQDPEAAGWSVIAQQEIGEPEWMLLRRNSRPVAGNVEGCNRELGRVADRS